MRAFIPHIFTLANAFSGSMAVIFLFREEITTMWILFGMALLFDLLDGAVARALNVNSSLGKELDSLADTISFSLLPGLVLFQWLYQPPFDPFISQSLSTTIMASAGLIFTLSGIFRLAVFNLDEGQRRWFTGLPTPAAAIFVMALSVYLQTANAPEWLFGSYALYGVIFLLSWMMVSSIRIINLKFSSFQWSANRHRYILLIVLAIGAVYSWRLTLLLAIPWLLIWSLFYYNVIEAE